MTLTHPTILVADDDPLSRLFVRNALEPAGMTVIEAMGGKDALTKFETLAPDLVVLHCLRTSTLRHKRYLWWMRLK